MSKACIIIPCYNEEKRLNKSAFSAFLKENKTVSFCFSNDGSTDNTSAVLESIKNEFPESVYIVSLKQNSGKAEAVREGVMHIYNNTDVGLIGFWDADLSTPLNEINEFINVFDNNDKIIAVIGSRIKRLGAKIDRKPMRHYLGRIFSTFSSILLKLPVYDSQCGAKIFKREIVKTGFESRFLTKWLFDVEILARIRNESGAEKCCKIIYEMPVNSWEEIGGSKLKYSYFVKVPFELIKIHNFYKKS